MVRLATMSAAGLLFAAAPWPTLSQTVPQQQQQDGNTILVEGKRFDANGKPIPMSDWWVAESEHVVVYSRGQQARVTRIANNLEKLHFLLSMLFNRVDKPDDLTKLSVTLIGDHADFEQLRLDNARWEAGPYPTDFPQSVYYDPREDGAVVAVPYWDQKILLQPGKGKPSKIDVSPTGEAQETPASTSGMIAGGSSSGPPVETTTSVVPDMITVNEVSIVVPIESRIYAAYAQHYLMTYYPAAYPRWFLEGFGEIFSTIESPGPGSITYGAEPPQHAAVNDKFGYYSARRILTSEYLEPDAPRMPKFTPYRAWQLAHLLFFNEEWKEGLHNYLAAFARGESAAEATAQIGDLDRLEKQYVAYHNARVPNETLTFPSDRTLEPVLRQLDRSEASYVKGKLVIGARLDLPPAPAAGTDPGIAAQMAKRRNAAIAQRDRWIADIRKDAALYPDDAKFQLLVAEAECRSGNAQGCITAADRALAINASDAQALSWKGTALVQLALEAPADQRAAKLRQARGWIVRANRADNEAIAPLLAYYRSYADAGATAPEVALLGLVKANSEVPASPTVRLLLGAELATQGKAQAARDILMPLANSGYDFPEKPKAQAILASLDRQPTP